MTHYLLDTCAFLWLDAGAQDRFSPVANELLASDVTLVLSEASIWELAIKSSLGRLQLASSIENLIDAHIAAGLRTLPIHRNHLFAVESLPLHHRDPFDRLIAIQALQAGLPIITPDEIYDRYGVERLWT